MKISRADDFRTLLQSRLAQAQKNGESRIDVRAADLLRDVGGNGDHEQDMAICSEVMQQAVHAQDHIIDARQGTQDANLTIRYRFPRPSS